MESNRKVLFAKVVTVLGVGTLMVRAFDGGPDPGNTAAPGENPQGCAQATCHTGPGNPTMGGIEIDFPQGTTYTPGAKQRWTVRITGATGAGYGFQATARPASNERTGQAGRFEPIDATTFVLCQDGRERGAGNCRDATPIEFIEHRRPKNVSNFVFEWTPPATNVGNVRIYVGANAANLNGQNTGDQIFLRNFTLTPQASGPPPPQIRTTQPVLQAFSQTQIMSPGTWIQIYGVNFGTAAFREWAGSDFNGTQAPTSLDNVRVNVDGRPAYIWVLTPTQVNAQVPDGIGAGSAISVEVVTPNGSSRTTVNAGRTSPALITTDLFRRGTGATARQYVAAFHAGTDPVVYVGPTDLIPGVSLRPAKTGDVITIYAVGCGPTSPASPAGQIITTLNRLSSSFQVRFGQTAATADAFMQPSFVGLCRFDVTVPALAAGDIGVDVTVDGIANGQNLFTTIGN